MVDRGHRRVGDELVGNRELVLGQEGDEELGRLDRLGTLEHQLEAVTGAGEGCAGPAGFLVREEPGVTLRERALKELESA